MGNMANALRHSDTSIPSNPVLGGLPGYVHGMRHSDSGVRLGHMSGPRVRAQNMGVGAPGAQLATDMLEQLKLLHMGQLRGPGFPRPPVSSCGRQPPAADGCPTMPLAADQGMRRDVSAPTISPSSGPGSLRSVSPAGRPTLEFLLKQQPPLAAAPPGADVRARGGALERGSSAASSNSLSSSEGLAGSPREVLLGDAEQPAEEPHLADEVNNLKRVPSQEDGSFSDGAQTDSASGSPREQVRCVIKSTLWQTPCP
jgi:hypothetical protein